MTEENQKESCEVERPCEKVCEEKYEELRRQVCELQSRLDELSGKNVSKRATLLVFSGDMDRLLTAFILATGGVAMGLEVSMFFTFWGLVALKKRTLYRGKNIVERMIQFMLPGGPESVGASKMHMFGMGTAFLRAVMKKKNVESLPELIVLAREMEVRMIACQMSMGVMGIVREELIDGIEYGGVATCIESASHSGITLYI